MVKKKRFIVRHFDEKAVWEKKLMNIISIIRRKKFLFGCVIFFFKPLLFATNDDIFIIQYSRGKFWPCLLPIVAVLGREPSDFPPRLRSKYMIYCTKTIFKKRWKEMIICIDVFQKRPSFFLLRSGAVIYDDGEFSGKSRLVYLYKKKTVYKGHTHKHNSVIYILPMPMVCYTIYCIRKWNPSSLFVCFMWKVI